MPRTIELLPGESLTLRSGFTIVAARDAAEAYPTTVAAAELPVAGAKTEVFVLPAGTICKLNGVPFRLMNATQVECSENSFRWATNQDVRGLAP